MRTLSGSRADAERVDPELGGSCGDAAVLLAVLEKSFVLLLLRGDVSVLLAVLEKYLSVVPEIFVVLVNVDSRVFRPVRPPRPCLLRYLPSCEI